MTYIFEIPDPNFPIHFVTFRKLRRISNKQTNYFIVRLKVDQRAGQLSLPHLRITRTEKNITRHKTDEQICPVNGLEPRD